MPVVFSDKTPKLVIARSGTHKDFHERLIRKMRSNYLISLTSEPNALNWMSLHLFCHRWAYLCTWKPLIKPRTFHGVGRAWVHPQVLQEPGKTFSSHYCMAPPAYHGLLKTSGSLENRNSYILRNLSLLYRVLLAEALSTSLSSTLAHWQPPNLDSWSPHCLSTLSELQRDPTYICSRAGEGVLFHNSKTRFFH